MSTRSLIRNGLGVIFIITVIGLGSIWSRLSSYRHQTGMAESMREAEMTISALYSEAAQMSVSSRTLIIDPKNERAVGNHKKAEGQVQEYLKRFHEIAGIVGISPPLVEKVKELEKYLMEDISHQKEFMQLALKGDAAGATEVMKKVENPVWRKFRDELLELRKGLALEAERVVSEAGRQGDIQSNIIIGLSVLMTAVTFLVYLFATRSIRRLGGDIGGLRESVTVSNEQANQLTATSGLLSKNASRQAASLQQTTAALEEISQIVARNSESARLLQSKSEASRNASQSGQDAVHRMMEAIKELSDSNGDIMREIGASHQELQEIDRIISEIGAKTKVINDIVFQTKLLSFNASVEAARAGEHGKGFAVVAEEVGNLARLSGVSAQEISSILEVSGQKVQSIITSNQRKMEELMKRAESRLDQGRKTAEDCGHQLEKIVKNVAESNQMVGEIATASSEQTTGVREITQAMRSLDEVSQESAQAAEGTADSAQRIKEQAQALSNLMDRVIYTVEGKGNPSVESPAASADAGQVIPFNRKNAA